MRPRVFVVQAIPEPPLKLLEAVADVEVFPNLRRQISLPETIDGARGSDYLLGLHGNFVPAEVITANPSLKGVAFLGGKTVKVDFDAALARKVPVISSLPGATAAAPGGGVSVATADLTVGMLIALAYRLLDAPDEEARLGLEYVTLDELLMCSDYVCLEVRYNATTHKLIGAREFGLMKPSAYFINTARGRIVDEDALIQALQQRTIAGAALDVYYHEPPAVWDPEVPQALRELDNVILAPHNGGATYDSRAHQVMPLAEGIRDLIEGRRPRGLLNPEIYGEATLYPEFYGRGPIQAGDNGPTHFLTNAH